MENEAKTLMQVLYIIYYMDYFDPGVSISRLKGFARFGDVGAGHRIVVVLELAEGLSVELLFKP